DESPRDRNSNRPVKYNNRSTILPLARALGCQLCQRKISSRCSLFGPEFFVFFNISPIPSSTPSLFDIFSIFRLFRDPFFASYRALFLSDAPPFHPSPPLVFLPPEPLIPSSHD